MPRIRYLLAFTLGVLAMLAVENFSDRFAPCHRRFEFLNPHRRCIDAAPQGEWNYERLRNRLEAKKQEWKSSGALTHLSIYFQDLDHGPRFGIGEYDAFQPASLIKVPVLIFFLHAADLEPGIPEKQLSFTGDLDVPDNVAADRESIQPDVPYTVRELLRKMIVYSDNRSYLLLLREIHVLSESIAYDTFNDLDVLQMMLESETTYVSISSYARLFAVLYNTGYLSREMSQFALELLSESTFQGGIVAGLPEGTRVAHKFGYAVVGEDQLHDCGIVYHPKMAYILCVMTSGPNQRSINAAIVEVSRTVYETVSSLDFESADGDPAVP